MSDILPLLLSAGLGYLLGSVPFGLVLTRLAGCVDIRQTGSGNIGATNVLRAGYKGLALATFLMDAGKSALALFICEAMHGREAGLLAGLAAILGHCFPVWLRFRGGKAVAASFGFIFAAMWPVGVMAGLAWLLVAGLFHYSSLAALVSLGFLPLWSFLGSRDQAEWFCALCLSFLVLWRHAGNIRRLLEGREARIGAEVSGKGDGS